ncbi:TniB family NTP-binding protein [Deinococcus sp. HMF7604]|uniref:TniB family NTP-binding protein n=1 Tax=Deinococcus betulae TaxID=2873312 RepID=UPI001CCFC757|nr:TniB family NTP-binding protein [Deinococcus betulae]MBZ9751512.1 TniB family NTP-binding protein [Deinococcus betulae]
MTAPLFGQPAYEHLSPETRAVVGMNSKVREDWLYQMPFFAYDAMWPIFNEAMFLARQPRLPRPHNLLIEGPTNSGKSALLALIAAALKPGGDHALDHPVPVMLYKCASGVRRDDLVDGFLRGSGLEILPRRRLRAGDLIHYAPIMRLRGPRVVLIDEVHNLFSRAGSKHTVTDTIPTLRDLSMQCQVPLIAAGVKKALYAIQSDPQLENRFTVMRLPPLQSGAPFVRMLMAFERWLPLPEPSQLRQPAFAQYLYDLSGGWIGELKDVLHRGLRYAIQHQTPCLIVDLMQAAGCLSAKERRAVDI